MPIAKGGQDPTRHEAGGSRTETKIAQESTLGSDRSDDATGPGPDESATERSGRQATASSQGRELSKAPEKLAGQGDGGA